ncbi:hypothetical protein [Zestomonas carbonaria]|uniref:Sel1 repeat family protein n=1 Tax=Zestomonas carbonaria TaxID=2762745 RepID=A0A7U7EPB8_9GAMM|nr:hypothetical protein [Pseudomonas carbonaria]CAD5108630.1 hypothetical protein PSEWESI4_02922 [Pseudomonas carbonaria]
MTRWLLLAAPLLLAGCVSTGCDDAPLSGSSCREEHLLQQNDMLQAKLLIASGDLENYELARALLNRAAPRDSSGEVPFYQAVLLIREGPQVDEVLGLLEDAAAKGHPHAIALLYKIHSEPYLIAEADLIQAESYRATYASLDVAKSGYPSFDQALRVVDGLLGAPATLPADGTAGSP